ncbi:aminopeptidase [Tumebacillus sp. DT12]|uniref:Aminopeptidase n=1 Tax=Tumebacillus lacus TaxID=2995335 RepID=A0ABT3X712_9BACL|nr:aminopeptidase [Tumebacillus lacus]MCX7570529.1 aminopeptidase [Tumebacillus lacus]
MRDPRFTKLAEILTTYSTDLKPGEKVLIESFDGETHLTKELIKAAYKAGAQPYLWVRQQTLLRELYVGATKEQMDFWTKADRDFMAEMDAYIGIRSYANSNEMHGVPAEQMKLYNETYFTEVHRNTRVPGTKWTVLRYPTQGMAQASGLSIDEFTDFYFDVCTLDYAAMSKEMDPLKELMEKTDKVRITGPGTDLTFSIKGIPAVKCDGDLNIPDGEVYTAPVRDSINGTLQYNVPSVYNGITFDNIRLVFKDGQIVEATANDTEKINEIFDTDEGARYIGEFSIAFNPYILEPMKDILFDEKISGSFHFTPGNAYKNAYNGNQSAIHWDLVCIQRPEYGGGEIWFDDRLIRKDGLFVIPELAGLNPDQLKK